MRSTLQVILAVLLAAVFVAPVAAAGPGGATQETISGVLEAVHVDEFATGREHEEYSLRTSHGVIPLEFADGGPDGFGGASVTVTGSRSGKVLRIGSSHAVGSFRVTRRLVPGTTETVQAETGASSSTAPTVATTSMASATAASPVAKNFAVVLINFTNLTTQPFTKSAAQTALTASSGSLKDFYQEESKGLMTVTGTVFGWYTINATTTGCDWRTWHTLGWNAATGAGVDLNAYTNVIFVWPETSQCAFAGLGYVPGKYSYLNGTINVQVMTHEVGHNFGLGHANARTCTVNGTRVTIAADASCTTQNYADPFSTMGNNALRHNHGSQLGELGWLQPEEKVTGSPGNTYTIAPYFGAAGVKLVRVPRGDGTFFDLDVRTPYGSFDTWTVASPAVSGVTIRIGKGTASPTNTPQATELLDTTPATADLNDAPLLVGRTMTDPVSGLSFTTMSISSAGVVVRVREGVAPSAPGSLSGTATDAPSAQLAWSAATDNVAISSYRITRDGSLVASPAADVTSWTDGNVAFGATYAYGVAAVDTSGNVGPATGTSVTLPAAPDPTPAPSAAPSAPPDPTATPDPAATPSPTTPPPDPTPTPPPPTPDPTPTPPPGPDTQTPSVPDPISAAPSTTTVRLTWGAATDDVGVAGYRVTRNGTLVATIAGTAWTDSGRTPRTTYAYTVTAVDGAAHVSDAAVVTATTKADTVRPSTPRSFHRVSRSGRYVGFAWKAATDNVKVVRYYIYRVGRSTPVASTASTRIRISAAYGARYYVRAMDAAHNKSYASSRVRGR
jgi:outer membrane biosynthesis protein TonB